MNLSKLRIHPAIKAIIAVCEICGRRTQCGWYDRDLLGHVCWHCSGFVIKTDAFLQKFFNLPRRE